MRVRCRNTSRCVRAANKVKRKNGQFTVHTVQLSSTTEHIAAAGLDLLPTNVHRTVIGRHYYTIDPEKYNPHANDNIFTLTDTINDLVSDYGLKDVEILRVDIRFDFIGIEYDRLFPIFRVLSALLASESKARNSYVSQDSLSPEHKTIVFKAKYFDFQQNRSIQPKQQKRLFAENGSVYHFASAAESTSQDVRIFRQKRKYA